MQMLNFVKISTLLLLLQLISINTQHNKPNTVTVQTITPDVYSSKPTNSPVTNEETIISIRIKYVGTRKDTQENTIEHINFKSFMRQAEKRKSNYVCEVFTNSTLTQIPKKYVAVDCRNVRITPFFNQHVDGVILAESELTYTYNNTVKVDKEKLLEEMMKKAYLYELLLTYNFMIKVTVKTKTPDDLSAEPTSTPVTIGKTVVKIIVVSKYYRTKEAIFDVNRCEFFAKLPSGRIFLTDQYCEQFKRFAQSFVPKNWEEFRCSDISSKVVVTQPNDYLIRTVSQLDFIYTNAVDEDNETLTKTLYKKIREGNLKDEASLNRIVDGDFKVSVQTITPDVFSNEPPTTSDTNGKTVVKIIVNSYRLNKNVANIDLYKEPVYHYNKAGVKTKKISYCETFMPWAMDSLPPNPQATGCIDIQFKTWYHYMPQFALLGNSELEFTYPELVEIDNNNLKKALKIKYDKKQDTSQMEPNLIEILNFDVIVQTTKPDVPSSRPTSTPVTIGKTVSVHTVAPDVSSSKPTGTSVTDVKTIVIIQVLSYYSETIKSVDDLSMKWFYIYRTLDDSRKFRKACMLYMSLIKRWVPKHFQQSKCNDVKSEVVQRNVNISSVKTLSEFKVTYSNIVELDVDAVTTTLKAKSNKRSFKERLRRNDISFVDFHVSVEHN